MSTRIRAVRAVGTVSHDVSPASRKCADYERLVGTPQQKECSQTFAIQVVQQELVPVRLHHLRNHDCYGAIGLLLSVLAYKVEDRFVQHPVRRVQDREGGHGSTRRLHRLLDVSVPRLHQLPFVAVLNLDMHGNHVLGQAQPRTAACARKSCSSFE